MIRFWLDQNVSRKTTEFIILLRVHPQTMENLHPVVPGFLQRVGPEEMRGAVVTVDFGHD